MPHRHQREEQREGNTRSSSTRKDREETLTVGTALQGNTPPMQPEAPFQPVSCRRRRGETKELHDGAIFTWGGRFSGCGKRNQRRLKANGARQLLQPEETRVCSLLFLIWSSILINNGSD